MILAIVAFCFVCVCVWYMFSIKVRKFYSTPTMLKLFFFFFIMDGCVFKKNLLIYLFIFGCVGSSFLCEGFL